MAGHVYLIGSRIFNWYKIGKSGNAAIRVAELGILLPFRIEVIAIWKAHNHHKLEKLLHEKFATQRINGEWFQFVPGQVEFLVNEMAVAQIDVASTFSNIEKDAAPNKREATVVYRRIKRDISNTRVGAGVQRRMDQLIKRNHELEAALEKLLDKEKLTVI